MCVHRRKISNLAVMFGLLYSVQLSVRLQLKTSQVKRKAGCKSATTWPIVFLVILYMSAFIIGPLQMLISQSILKQFWSGPTLTNYIIPHQISTNLNHFYLSQFSTYLDQHLDITSHDQSKVYDTTPNIN